MEKVETNRTGFATSSEVHPSKLVEGGKVGKDDIGIQELRAAIPDHCFKPSLFWSFFYLGRDLTYSAVLITAFFQLLFHPAVQSSSVLYYAVVNLYAVCQGIVWTGLWVIAHDCGHSGFSRFSALNDAVGFVLHSSLLTPYFSWKSTHRRHHIYANHIEKDLNYVPPQRNEYAKKIGVAAEMIDEVGQDAPIVLLIRILIQQTIGWNYYILSNITCPPTAVPNRKLSAWRFSHFDPWGALFRSTEIPAILLSDLGCLLTALALYSISTTFNVSAGTMFWLYVMPWTWVNHWIVMITYLHHTHPSVPKYTVESWTFMRGATATIDRDFGFIGTHFFHHISTDHVTHHLFSRIPHYYSREATNAIVPLLGKHYHGRTTFGFDDLKLAFSDCQWVEEDAARDKDFGLVKQSKDDKKNEALWYRCGVSPAPEYKMREAEFLPRGKGPAIPVVKFD